MVKNEFENAMRDFVKNFGADNYPSTRMQLIWDAVRDLPEIALRRIVRALIGEFKPAHPPKISVIVEFAETERKYLTDKKMTAALFTDSAPGEPTKVYLNTKDAISDVAAFYQSMIPAGFRSDAKTCAEERYAVLDQEVGALKSRVESGDVSSCGEYVSKARHLIILLARHAVLPQFFGSIKTTKAKGDL